MSGRPTPAQAPEDPPPATGATTRGKIARGAARRIKAIAGAVWSGLRPGERSSLPVLIGLAAVWLVFQGLDGGFLSPRNLSSISVDIVGTGMIAAGIIFVLLIGEIDLSVGSLSGLAGAAFAALNVNLGLPEWLAVVLAVLTGTVAGAVQGFVFATTGVPAFAITLAGLLAWNGLMLYLLIPNGSIDIGNQGFVASLTSHYFSDAWVGYGLAAAGVAVYLLAALRRSRRRRAAEVPFQPLREIWVRAGVLAAVMFASAWVLNEFDGLPLALLIFLLTVAGLDYVLHRTRYGRMVIAVGGGVEAARRAGFDVVKVRISVFMVSGTLAAVGGLFITSQFVSATSEAGSGPTLINAIAAAVLGGASLFGGRGTIWSALLGVLVIESIASGMALLGAAEPAQLMVTGGVLLAAVIVDSLLRRVRQAHGQA